MDWKDYVRLTCLEITCGEGPYLVSRYDTTTGEPIPIDKRIGLLDRKLRTVSKHTDTTEEWLQWAEIAYQNTYGYEWQGDNLLIARRCVPSAGQGLCRAEISHAETARAVSKTQLLNIKFL